MTASSERPHHPASTRVPVTLLAGPSPGPVDAVAAAWGAQVGTSPRIELGVGDDPVARCRDVLGDGQREADRPPGARAAGVLVVCPPEVDPVSVAAVLLSDTWADAHLRLDGVVAALDGPTMSVRLRTGRDPVDVGVARLVGLADRVVLTNAHRLLDVVLEKLPWCIWERGRLATTVLLSAGEPGSASALPEPLHGLRAWQPAVAHRRVSHPPYVGPAADGVVAPVLVRADGLAGRRALRCWLRVLVHDLCPRLVRGIVTVPGPDGVAHVAVVAGSGFRVGSVPAAATDGARALLVGTDLDAPAIARSFAAALR